MNEDILQALIAFAAGLFSIAGGYFEIEWFMRNSKAQFIIGLLGYTGARIFYIGLGIFLIGLAMSVIVG